MEGILSMGILDNKTKQKKKYIYISGNGYA